MYIKVYRLRLLKNTGVTMLTLSDLNINMSLGQNSFLIKINGIVNKVCAIYSLFEIVTLLLQPGLVFADCQQLRLSLLKAA